MFPPIATAAETSFRLSKARAAGWILLAQGACLVATFAVSWWFLRHVDASVADAVQHHPADASQADHVRSEIAAFQENRMIYAAVAAPMFLVAGGWLLRHPSRV